MRLSTFRRVSSFVAVLLLLCASFSALADTPFQRARQRGRRYVHRPMYKQYQRPAHRGGVLALFGK
ncbi:hypothetical protein [Hymenobacter chitinivorans]|uniref:Uncharacterized protein n=1 Tax=Hymenobacter chitinivorans DSM 11115 TaxID=1121954 RepID=A0A2M9AQF3_9BACT|nr:hypothetical protein [Hymenobacter chitinivorans]PJJ47883.1 hypothetical protein CLV45_4573 [Hymenobacter chitinivorans DSM 11115]